MWKSTSRKADHKTPQMSPIEFRPSDLARCSRPGCRLLIHSVSVAHFRESRNIPLFRRMTHEVCATHDCCWPVRHDHTHQERSAHFTSPLKPSVASIYYTLGYAQGRSQAHTALHHVIFVANEYSRRVPTHRDPGPPVEETQRVSRLLRKHASVGRRRHTAYPSSAAQCTSGHRRCTHCVSRRLRLVGGSGGQDIWYPQSLGTMHARYPGPRNHERPDEAPRIRVREIPSKLCCQKRFSVR
ncbi:hypothetical protein C8Q80DRAFT_366569 [Daedaleopsis nitida]|nr:hypothetical protein C8Q80DRAFT_366569 [Daedaleopsis nitida]